MENPIRISNQNIKSVSVKQESLKIVMLSLYVNVFRSVVKWNNSQSIPWFFLPFSISTYQWILATACLSDTDQIILATSQY